MRNITFKKEPKQSYKEILNYLKDKEEELFDFNIDIDPLSMEAIEAEKNKLDDILSSLNEKLIGKPSDDFFGFFNVGLIFGTIVLFALAFGHDISWLTWLSINLFSFPTIMLFGSKCGLANIIKKTKIRLEDKRKKLNFVEEKNYSNLLQYCRSNNKTNEYHRKVLELNRKFIKAELKLLYKESKKKSVGNIKDLEKQIYEKENYKEYNL